MFNLFCCIKFNILWKILYNFTIKFFLKISIDNGRCLGGVGAVGSLLFRTVTKPLMCRGERALGRTSSAPFERRVQPEHRAAPVGRAEVA